MTTTTTADFILQDLLDQANPNVLPDGFRKVKLGHMFSQVKAVVTALSATATPDITTAAVKAAAVITGITLATGENLPAIGKLVTLRVTASGTAASLGTYILTDSGGTAIIPPGGASTAVGIAKISDDGKTITFPNTVTAFVLMYRPAPAVLTSASANL